MTAGERRHSLRCSVFTACYRPGDHVVWKTEDVKQPAIVQHVNAVDRTAEILLADSGSTELASVLELDPHGTSDLAAVMPQSASEGLGVRRGDFVFIHREGTTNGFDKPCVPRIGELETWVREGPFLDGRLSGWRKEMSDIGASLATKRGEEPNESKIRRPSRDDGLLWLGEVTNVCHFKYPQFSWLTFVSRTSLTSMGQ